MELLFLLGVILCFPHFGCSISIFYRKSYPVNRGNAITTMSANRMHECITRSVKLPLHNAVIYNESSQLCLFYRGAIWSESGEQPMWFPSITGELPDNQYITVHLRGSQKMVIQDVVMKYTFEHYILKGPIPSILVVHFTS